MAVFDGVTVNQLNDGLGRRNPTNDGVCLLVIHEAVAASGLAVNTALQLLSLQNAEDVGIDASYDDTNDILAHYHIDEFFRVSPDGTLYVVLADNTFDDDALKQVLRDNDDIRAVGIARNSNVAELDFSGYIGGYQNIVNDLKAEHMRVDAVLVEGNEFDDQDPVSGYDDLRAEGAPNVSVVAVQDPAIRAIKSEYEGLAAIGTFLGGISVRSVNENLGSVDIQSKPAQYRGQTTYPLTDTGRGRWLSAVLQNGTPVSALSRNERISLDTKGYLFAGTYAGLAGVFISNSATCEEFASDYAYIENNRVWNKAARLLRSAMLPRVKSNLLKDASTGFLRTSSVKELEQIGLNALNTMESAGEISGARVYINPQQTVNQQTPLVVKAQVVANDIIFDISIDLGLTNQITT